MHEQGYQFIGDTSYYKLTIPEMRVLAAGFEVMQQTKKDARNGVTNEHREGLAEYDRKLKQQGGRTGASPDPRHSGGTGQSARAQPKNPGTTGVSFSRNTRRRR